MTLFAKIIIMLIMIDILRIRFLKDVCMSEILVPSLVGSCFILLITFKNFADGERKNENEIIGREINGKN